MLSVDSARRRGCCSRAWAGTQRCSWWSMWRPQLWRRPSRSAACALRPRSTRRTSALRGAQLAMQSEWRSDTQSLTVECRLLLRGQCDTHWHSSCALSYAAWAWSTGGQMRRGTLSRGTDACDKDGAMLDQNTSDLGELLSDSIGNNMSVSACLYKLLDSWHWLEQPKKVLRSIQEGYSCYLQLSPGDTRPRGWCRILPSRWGLQALCEQSGSAET